MDFYFTVTALLSALSWCLAQQVCVFGLEHKQASPDDIVLYTLKHVSDCLHRIMLCSEINNAEIWSLAVQNKPSYGNCCLAPVML